MSRPRDDFFDEPAGRRGTGGLHLAAVNEAEQVSDVVADIGDARPGLNDPLLQALSWITRFHGRTRSPASLIAGMPVDGALAPDQALRVMREAGYNAGLVRKQIDEINGLLMPVVLLLNGGDACVLTKRLPGSEGAPDRYEVVFAAPDAQSCVATAAELESEFSGFVMLVSPVEVSQAQERQNPLFQAEGSHWLWGTLRRFIPYYRAAFIAALLSNVLMLVSGLVTSVIYDKVIPHQAFVTLWTLAIGAGLALAFDLFARQMRAHLIDLAGRKADLIIGSKLIRQALGVRMEHRPESAGAYAHFLGQIEVVRDFFASATMSVLTDLPFVLLYMAMIFVIGGPLGWVLVMALPLILIVNWIAQTRMRAAMRANFAEVADLHGTLVEAVEGLEDLKSSGAEGRFQHRYETSSAAAAATGLQSRTMAAWTNNFAMTVQQAVNMVMLVWGVYLIHDGATTAGGVLGAVMFAGRAVAPLNMMVGLTTRYQGARAAMASLESVMSKPVERDATRSYVPLHQVQGHLSMHEVSFSYPPQRGQMAPKVLKSVNLKLNAGERIAILGRIGSGKSTILRLLAHLYQPTEGMVDLDGIDLRQIDPAEFRQHVGFVSQEPRLFHGSLRDNVTMGRAHVDAQRLVEVAHLTGLDKVVAAHPMGWDLPVGEQGGLLSGGQRQLVALARALVSKPQILLMDEPTSSMDAQSEIAFLRQLRDAAGTCTLVVVTHRPAVLELVTRIIVVDAGRPVLDGPRDQVLAALSGVRPAAPAQGAPAGADLHMHPSAQPVQRNAAV